MEPLDSNDDHTHTFHFHSYIRDVTDKAQTSVKTLWFGLHQFVRPSTRSILSSVPGQTTLTRPGPAAAQQQQTLKQKQLQRAVTQDLLFQLCNTDPDRKGPDS